MTTIIRGLYATDMMAVNRPGPAANDCTCGHDAAPSTVHGRDASPVFSAFDAGLKPYEAMKEISAAGLQHFGVAADFGKMTAYAAKARALWGR